MSDQKRIKSKDNQIIKMPEPETLVERQQARLAAKGITPDQCRLTDVQLAPERNEACIELELSPEYAAALERLLSSPKLHNPQATPGRRSFDVNQIEYEIEIQVQSAIDSVNAKDWSHLCANVDQSPNRVNPRFPTDSDHNRACRQHTRPMFGFMALLAHDAHACRMADIAKVPDSPVSAD